MFYWIDEAHDPLVYSDDYEISTYIMPNEKLNPTSAVITKGIAIV